MHRRDFLTASTALLCTLAPSWARAQARPCPPARLSAQSGSAALSRCGRYDAETDWQLRTNGPGVVWFHDFRSDAEVNNFRWTGGYVGGNDPLAVGSALAPLVRRISTDGVTPGGCLEIVRPAGNTDGSVWWRPFSPIVGGTTSGNGRGVDDPGAGGQLRAQAYEPTDGGSQIARWGPRGYYGQAGAGPFDGRDYFLQMRVKIDPARIQGGNEATLGGKLIYLTRTDRSLTAQEIVVYSGAPVSGDNYFRMYRSGSPPMEQDSPGVAVHGQQPGTEYGTVGDKLCDFYNANGRLANCWHWPSGQWATVMWHVRCGTSSGHDTLVEAYVAGPGETRYTRIWNQPGVNLPFDSGLPWGHNALICSAYQNGQNLPLQFYHRYDQIIFSQQFIPCPQV